MRWRFTWLSTLLVLVPITARADVKPHALCGDGMVLQQKTKVNVWGTADKGEKVTIDFRGKKASATADNNGKWLVSLDSGVAGGPLEMTIAGKNKLHYTNVLVGEVWICSGQSNMQWSVAQSGDEDKKIAATSPPNPQLRHFYVPHVPRLTPQTDVTGTWVEADPKTIPSFTAVGYFYGRKLQHDLKVPIGLINTSVGGTRAEAWTKKENLDSHPGLRQEHEKLSMDLRRYVDNPKGGKSPVHANTASALYNGMIAPLLNYTIRGAIWYQGESNASRAYDYRALFPLMIENWRRDWKLGEFPFFFVQLAPFTSVAKAPGESDWAELREAQAMTLKLGNTGMAVITDLGSEYDIHPTPKHPVGERLARIALARVYGEKIEYSGPTLENAKFEGNKVVLTFAHAAGGLVAKELVPTSERKDKSGQVRAAWRVKEGSTSAAPTGFTVCGKDSTFHPAKAEIMGSTIVLTCEAVPEPIAVRFGWANHPLCNVFNQAGLPASPFRTDDFPAKTAPKQ
jgi:sialate O-acetylesterase